MPKAGCYRIFITIKVFYVMFCNSFVAKSAQGLISQNGGPNLGCGA